MSQCANVHDSLPHIFTGLEQNSNQSSTESQITQVCRGYILNHKQVTDIECVMGY